MNDQTPDFDDVRYQEEQREFVKQEGIGAYVDLIMDSLGNKTAIDPAKRELIREGIKALIGGSPRPPAAIPMTTPSLLTTPSLPSPYFEEQQHVEEGWKIRVEITIWNWPGLMHEATHATRYEDGEVIIWNGSEPIICLNKTRPAARAFWEWYTAITRFNSAPYGGRA